MNRGSFAALFALLCVAMPDRGAAPSEVFVSDFRKDASEHWLPFQVSTAPNKARRFLGAFGRKSSALLRLDHLPPHHLVRVRFTLFLLYGPDGNSKSNGPDVWSLSVAGGPTLLRTTFDTRYATQPEKHPQSFPDEFPIDHPAGTGAAERGSLGFHSVDEYGRALTKADLVYHLEAVFPHDGEDVELRFSSDFTQGPPSKAWGLENVTVETMPEFVEHSDAEARQLWSDFTGSDAMRSWNTLWRLAEGGPATVAFVSQRLGAGAAADRAQHLVHDLIAGDALAREKANAVIDDLAPSDILMLRAAVATSETPDSLRLKLKKILAELDAESPVFLSRVTRLLRVIATPEAKQIIRLFESPATPPSADSPMTLAWQNSHAMEQESAAIRCVFMPDGKQLLSAGGDGIRLWDVATGACVRFVPISVLRSLAVSPNGAAVAAGTKQSAIYVWSLPDWKLRTQLAGHRGQLWSLVFTPDSKQLWSGALDGIRSWDVETLQQNLAVPVPALTRYLSISPDGKILAASQNQARNVRPAITLRDSATGQVFHNITDFPEKLTHSDFSPDGKLLAVTPFNGRTFVYSVETKRKEFQFEEPNPEGECVTFSPGGKYLCVAGGGGDETTSPANRGLHLYRLADSAEVWRFNGAKKCYSAAFSADGSHFAATDDEGNVYLWEVRRDLEAP